MARYASGNAATEQDIITALETFLTSTIGTWTKVGTITDTASDRDYVFSSEGSVSGRYDPIYVRFRAYNNNIYVYGYTYWASAVDNTDEMYDASVSYIPVGGTNMDYWLFGTEDWVWIVVKNSGTNYYHSCFGGYINSYYSDADDDYPLAIVGHASANYGYDSNRCLMYYPLISGTSGNYHSADTHTSLLAYGDPNERDQSQAHIPLVMYCSTAGQKEVRGELNGVLRYSGATLSSEDWVVVSGISQKFFIAKYDTDTCFGFGPVAV